MNADLINGAFEFMAGLMMANNCRVLLRDRAVAGVSIASMAFFSAWGIWNLWYYPSLGQTWSFVGGIFVVTANVAYVALLCRFSGIGWWLRERWLDVLHTMRRLRGWVVCLFKGHRYDAPFFHSNCLYFCNRCGREMLGRTFDDIEPLSDEDREVLERLDWAYEEDHRHA